MKKILLMFILCAGLGTCITSQAEGWHHGGGHYYYHPTYGWIVRAVVGGVIVYGATRPQPVYVQPVMPPPVSAPVYPQPANYHWEAILDQNCNCYRTVLVPN